MSNQLVMGSTNVVDLSKLKDVITSAFLQGATVTLTLLDGRGATVAGADSLALEQLAGTSGEGTIYRTSIPHTVRLTEGASYTVRVTATSAGDGSVREFNRTVPAVRG